jgi:hypothetical protein
MIQASHISKIVLPPHADPILKGQPRGLWGVGNAEILRRPLLALISSQQIERDLELTSLQLTHDWPLPRIRVYQRLAFAIGAGMSSDLTC